MISPADMFIYAIIWFLLAILGAAMLGRFNRAGTGFLLGLILGPLGILIAWGIRDHESAKQYRQVRDALEATRDDLMRQPMAVPANDEKK